MLLAFVSYLVGGAFLALSSFVSDEVGVRILAGIGVVAAAHFFLLLFVLTPMRMLAESRAVQGAEDATITNMSEEAKDWLLRHADRLPTGRVSSSDMITAVINELKAVGVIEIRYVGSGSWSSGEQKPDHPRPLLTEFGSRVLQRLVEGCS